MVVWWQHETHLGAIAIVFVFIFVFVFLFMWHFICSILYTIAFASNPMVVWWRHEAHLDTSSWYIMIHDRWYIPLLLRRIRWWFGGSMRHILVYHHVTSWYMIHDTSSWYMIHTIAFASNPMVVWWQHEAHLGAARRLGRGGEQGERGAEPDTWYCLGAIWFTRSLGAPPGPDF